MKQVHHLTNRHKSHNYQKWKSGPKNFSHKIKSIHFCKRKCTGTRKTNTTSERESHAKEITSLASAQWGDKSLEVSREMADESELVRVNSLPQPSVASSWSVDDGVGIFSGRFSPIRSSLSPIRQTRMWSRCSYGFENQNRSLKFSRETLLTHEVSHIDRDRQRERERERDGGGVVVGAN